MKIKKDKLESLINESLRREVYVPLMLHEVFRNGVFNMEVIMEENGRVEANFHKIMSMLCSAVERVTASPDTDFPFGYKEHLVGEFTSIVNQFEKTVSKYYKALKTMGKDVGSAPPECKV